MTGRAVHRGVPQGSVLDLLLWNIAYDPMLRTPMSSNSALACYADNTLVLVWGTAWGRTVCLAELAVACAVAEIKGLGLRVSPEKSEAIWFCRRADHGTLPAGYRLRLEGAEIEVGTSMKYLGQTLDSHWTFGTHFERLVPSVEVTANALGRPDDQLSQSPSGQEAAQDGGHQGCEGLPHHFGGSSGGVSPWFPPFELQALRCREIYLHTRGLSGGVGPVGANVRVRVRRALLDRWRASLDTRAGAPGLRDLEAVLPNWDVWLDGGRPPLTYRVTQVLTGHSCFGEYLHRIGKGTTARCHYCYASVDSAQHTLEY
ncbi:uncharacterized protein [Bombus flavifrons]|uniref:uncharacterized protein n=1 Tax=Bombus flavifrons TaxID=103934 RepID=UPI0037042996